MTQGERIDRYMVRPLAAGLVLGLSAVAIAPWLGLTISGDLWNLGGHVTWLNVLIGTFLCGALLWRVVMGGRGVGSPWRGALAGALGGLFAYPVVIALGEFMQREWSAAPQLAERIEQINLLTTLTLITTGPIAVLLMGITGAIVAIVFTRIWHQDVSRRPVSRPARITASILLLISLMGIGSAYAWLGARQPQAPVFSPLREIAENGFQDTVASFAGIVEREKAMGVHDLCQSTLLSHGERTSAVVIYFHGFTSCPAQGDALAGQVFALGYNVYMPRMYGHGLAEPTAADLDEFAADGLVAFATEAVDMARGLGDEVIVMGLSAGGTLGAWLAQFRDDIDHAILISPFFGPYIVPPRAMLAGTNLMLAIPNIVLPWNPLENATPEKAAIPHAIPGTHALIEIMLVGWQVHAEAQHTPPGARRISLLLNDADFAVNNRQTLEIARFWSDHGADVEIETLPFGHRLPHDMINTRERGANTDIVYPVLLTLLDAAR